jgi:flavin-dependent dehydrogenase
MALDMHSHVGKRTLLVGEAGGFVAAFNNDRLYAAMRSGRLAAEAAERALKSDLPQDELAGFEAAWRTELADYLRMPSTDLSLLMPLVFNQNLQMSQRVARAFLLGEKF